MGDQGMKNLKLKAARAGKDLSQQALADLVGVSRQTIAAVEKGDYNPTINLCIAICQALDKTLDELFWEEGIGMKGLWLFFIKIKVKQLKIGWSSRI